MAHEKHKNSLPEVISVGCEGGELMPAETANAKDATRRQRTTFVDDMTIHKCSNCRLTCKLLKIMVRQLRGPLLL